MKTFIIKTNSIKTAVIFFGMLFFAATGFSQTQTVIYNTTGNKTWTAPCGVTSITVQAWGGGGAGGGSTANNSKGGAGGAGGTYVSSTISVTPNSTYGLFVGTGASGSNGAGSQGGFSWFGNTTTIYAEGGKGGGAANGGTVIGGVGSTNASIGTTKIAGANGTNGTSTISGAGGTGANSGGAGGTARTTSGTGNPGSQPGGGGGGAFIGNNTNQAGGDGGSGEIIITYTGIATYCIPAFTANIEPITLVQFAGINNATSNVVDGTPAVESFCSPIMANVTQSSTYAITVKGNTDGFFTDEIKVFIDWNQNGVLDPGEATQVGTGITNSTGLDSKFVTANITVPATAVIGTTRMRVIKNYSGYGNACDQDYDYGQAEDYLVNVSAICTAPTGSTANNVSSSLTVCTGTQVTLRQTNGTLGSGQTWKWYSGSCGGTVLPGQTTNTNTDAAFTFTPAVGNLNYYVRAEGGTCGTGSCSPAVAIKVNDNATIVVTSGYSKDFSACKGVNNAIYTSFTLGGGATGASISGLPSGLTYNATGSPVIISGNPTVTGNFSYTITPTGNSPCTNASIPGTITVSQAPTSVTYASSVTYCSGALITPNSPVIGTGTGIPTNYTITGIPASLPTGLTLDPSTGTITGTPTVVSPFTTYTIKAQNNCGSVNTSVQIKISSGDNIYNITPTTVSQTYCSSTFTGVAIGLNGSDAGIVYQLFRNGSTLVTSVTGPVGGGPITFGNQTVAGTYTVTTNSACKTNMNGSFTINITLQPTTTFTYPNYNNCNQGLSSAAVLSGSPTTGTFSALPAGLVFNDNTTGIVDLAASSPGSYSIKYTVAASGSCSVYTYTQTNNFNIGSTPQVFNVYGGGGYCSGGIGVEIGLDNSELSVNYQLYRNGTTLVTTLAGTGTILSFGNQTVVGTYTIIGVKLPCQVQMNGNAVITVNPLPSPIVVTPASTTICESAIQSLTASVNPPTTSNGSVTISSGNINLSIPDYNQTGVSNTLKVTGVPLGSTIASVSINFNIAHTYDGDLVLNLKGPNGNVLNIANRIGSGGDNFTNTTVASNATNPIQNGSASFTGTYLPNAASGAIGAQVVTSNTSNVTTFLALYGAAAISANGNWIFSARDAGLFDNGTINNWSITINYTYVSNPVSVSWSPVTDLFSDPGAITPYVTGDTISTVYVKPSNYGSKTYAATAKNVYGCSVNSSATLTINQSPTLTVSADYCSLSAQNQVKVTANSDVNISTWYWTGGLTATNTATRSIVKPNSAGTYYVTATSATNSCFTTASMSVAQELVTNGDFENGNTGFTSGYAYVSNTIQNGLYPEGTYSVNNNPNFNHDNFWGTDHTTANGFGNFLLVNGVGGTTPPVVWSETVTVLPNTTYYFSAYATSLNNVTPFANLQFKVNGVAVGTNTGALPSKSLDNNPGTWLRFYGNWASNTATTAVIQIVDLTNAAGGNDFGLDDISFGTLSTFLNLTSPTGSNIQNSICSNSPIDTISYEVGGDGSQPVLSGLPTGLNTYWNGRDLIISGTPTQSGTYNYTVAGTGCNMRTATGKLIVLPASSTGSFTDASNSIISTCYGSSGPINVSGSTGTLTWESSTDGINFIPATQNYSNIQVPTYYRVTAQSGTGCTSATSQPVLLAIHNYWTGKTSSNWNTNTNWSDNQTVSFTTCNTAVIPAGTLNSPQLTAATTVQNINILSGAKLDLNNQTFTISGTYSGTGTLTGSIASNMVLTGNTGTLHFTPNDYVNNKLTNNYLKTLTVSNGSGQTAAIGDSLNIASGTAGNYGTVIVNSGGTLNANGNLILKSNANGTAVIGQSMGIINGGVTVERYIPELRAWRFIAAPFNKNYPNQTIRDAWQEGVNNYGLGSAYNQNPHPGFGTHITGNNYSNLGFDYNTTTNPSMRVWDSIANNWNAVEPPTISTGIASYPAYYLFVRGSRAVDLSQGQSAGGDLTVLRMKGELNQKGTSVSKLYNGKSGNWIFVGNPYASPVDINNVLNNANIQQRKFWVWDPKLSDPSWGTVGAYVTYDHGTMVPNVGSSYPSPTTIIQSGQGFLLQLNGSSSATFTFNESDKSATQANVFGFAKTLTDPPQVKIFANLYINQSDNGLLPTDGVATVFDNQFSSVVDDDDAIKAWGYFENISQVRDGKNLSIELRPQVKLTDTIFYRIYVRSSYPAYTIKLFTENINLMPLTRAWLVDKYLNTKTEVNLKDTTLYSFSPNSDVNSYLDRFMLVFNRQLLTTPVPVTKVANQQDPNITGIANSTAVSGVSISPNPVTAAKNAMLRFNNMSKGNYEVVVHSSKGQKLAIKKIQHDGSNTFYPLPEGSGWSAGIYSVSVYNEDTKTTINLKLVISK